MDNDGFVRLSRCRVECGNFGADCCEHPLSHSLIPMDLYLYPKPYISASRCPALRDHDVGTAPLKLTFEFGPVVCNAKVEGNLRSCYG